MNHETGEYLEYDPNWKGPLRKRHCTDILWLIVFNILMIVWIVIGVWAYRSGNLGKFIAPVDSEGQKCGYDNLVLNKTKLVFFDITKCIVPKQICNTPQVCVEHCPGEDFDFFQSSQFTLEQLRLKMICKTHVQVQNSSLSDLTRYVNEDECAAGYLTSESIMNRCFPTKINNKQFEQVLNSIKTLSLLPGILNDIERSGKLVLTFVLISALVSLIYIWLLRFFTTQFIFATLIAIFALLVVAVYYSYRIYIDYQTVWLLVITSLILIMYTLIVIIIYKKIKLSCTIIEEGSRAVTGVMTSLVFPIFPWILQLILILYAIFTFFNLQSMYEEKSQDSSYLNVLHGINIINFLWSLFFVTAAGEMILSGTFATWYWTYHKKDVPFFTITINIWRVLRYHLGTVAIGSLMVTICAFIRMIFQIEADQRQSNGKFACLTQICTCCWKWLYKTLLFINRNAYIICAIYGTNFIGSAKQAFNLITRNALKTIVVNKLTNLLLGLTRLSLCGLFIFLTWWYCDTNEYYRSIIIHPWVPMILVAIGTYFISTIFFMVLTTAIDTLFICFLEDCERNDGSRTKPYFMSKRLRTLLRANK